MWEQAEFLATNTDKDKKNRGARPRASLDCIHGTIPTRPDAPPALGAAHARCRADAAPESREGTRAAAASPLFRASHEVSAAAPAARHGRWAAGTPRQPLAQPPPAPVRRNAGRAAAPTPLPPRGGRLSHAPPMGAGKGEPLRGRAGPDGGGTSRIAARGASPSPASRSTSPAARRVAGPWSTPRRFCQTKKKGRVSERRPSPGCGPPARPGPAPTCPLENGAPTSATECARRDSRSPASARLRKSRAKPPRRAMTQEMPNRRMMPTAAAPLLLAGSSSARAAGPRPARTPPGRPANGGARARRCVPPTEQRGALRATRAANGYASRARPAGVFPLPPRGTRAPAPGGAAGEGGTAGGASACRLRRRASAPGAARRRGDPRAGAGASVSPKLVQPGSDRRSSFYAQMRAL